MSGSSYEVPATGNITTNSSHGNTSSTETEQRRNIAVPFVVVVSTYVETSAYVSHGLISPVPTPRLQTQEHRIQANLHLAKLIPSCLQRCVGGTLKKGQQQSTWRDFNSVGTLW